MAWTEMQNQAIYKKGKNIIVSAGAGSGKTAVLSERILAHCLEGKDICSFLVLTFTNAAASEMKERIRRKLIEHHLLEQASRIDSAFITTFDAYSLALVKKYYYYLGVEKKITIIDGSVLEVKRIEILNQMFDELYQQQDEKFFSLLKKYTKQNDDALKKMILNLSQKTELIVDEKTFYEGYESTYYNEAFLNSLLANYEGLAIHKIKDFIHELSILLELSYNDQESQKLYDDLSRQMPKSFLDSFDTASTWLQSFSFPRISSKVSSSVKQQKSICSEILKEIKEKFFSRYSSLIEAKEELYAIKNDVIYLIELVKELQERLMYFKMKIMAFDYIDIAKMAIRLVKNYPMVLSEIKESYTEILIDEYQDTSDIQEAFIQLISNHNCYMVGDIKQSIYRFRNANPYIFKEKYLQYENLQDGIKIDLTHNFRSCKEVIEDINLIFSNLMTMQIGDADYASSHQMKYGQTAYEKAPIQENHHMSILSYELEDGYTEDEMEAFICGYKIKQLMKETHKCLKKDSFKNLQYSDIAILIDKTKSFITFKRVFEYLGIPLSVEADLDLNDSILPKLFSNIFTLLIGFYTGQKDKGYEHALASIGRSFLFSYSDNEIYLMLKDGLQNELTHKVAFLAEHIEELALEEIYFKIVEEFHFYERLSSIGDVANSCVVLEYIHSLFEMMSSTGMDIYEASKYFSEIFEKGISLKYKLNENSTNCVHLMTIHKSKGLEFPYCFYPMLGSKFNQTELKENYGFSAEYGIYIPFSDETNSPTIIKSLAEEKIRISDLSEKIRLFYVALTRAREKMFFISKVPKDDTIISLNKARSFNDFLYTGHFFKEYFEIVQVADLKLSHAYLSMKKKSIQFNPEPIVYSEETLEAIEVSKGEISKELVELMDENLKQAIALGQAFHHCLEVLDFKNPNIEELPVDEFIKNTLKKVLQTEVFKDILNAKTYHEHEFFFEEYHGIIDLLCIYQDHIDIIDYKLSNTSSEEYKRQLDIYKKYVEHHFSLPVSCYLLSILKQEIKKVI